MRQWFTSLAERERRVLIAGAIAVVAILFWAFVWRPLTLGAADLRDAVLVKQQLLNDLERAKALAGATGASASRGNAPSLVVLVDRTHREGGLEGTLTRNQPDGSDGIRVTFQSAPFDAMVGWLAVLQREYGIHVESASFTGAREPGVVSATLVLRRS